MNEMEKWIDFKLTPPVDERHILVCVVGRVREGREYPIHIHLAYLRYIGSIPEWVAADENISDPYCYSCGCDIDEKILYWMPLPELPEILYKSD